MNLGSDDSVFLASAGVNREHVIDEALYRGADFLRVLFRVGYFVHVCRIRAKAGGRKITKVTTGIGYYWACNQVGMAGAEPRPIRYAAAAKALALATGAKVMLKRERVATVFLAVLTFGFRNEAATNRHASSYKFAAIETLARPP